MRPVVQIAIVCIGLVLDAFVAPFLDPEWCTVSRSPHLKAFQTHSEFPLYALTIPAELCLLLYLARLRSPWLRWIAEFLSAASSHLVVVPSTQLSALALTCATAYAETTTFAPATVPLRYASIVAAAVSEHESGSVAAPILVVLACAESIGLAYDLTRDKEYLRTSVALLLVSVASICRAAT
jgi:hypothetical protein